MKEIVFCLFVYLLLQGIQSQKCTGGAWEDDIVSEFCYMFKFSEQKNWDDARAFCENNGGDLIYITSLHEQRYIAGRTQQSVSDRLWIGLNDKAVENKWVWPKDAPFAYINWEPGSPKTSGDCVVIQKNNTMWTNRACSEENGFICKKRGDVPTPPPPTPSPQPPQGKRWGCRSGWKEWGGRCYFVGQDRFSNFRYQDAADGCSQRGGDLVSIADRDEHNFVKAFAKEQVTGGHVEWQLWIGLNERRTKNLYEWTDGSPVTYTSWNAGEPNNWEGTAEECVSLYVKTGDWNDQKCLGDHNNKGYICKSPRVLISNNIQPGTGQCPVGWEYVYREKCYMFCTDKRNWEQAKDRCREWQGADLVDIVDRFEQAFISSVLVTERGDHWIGLTNNGRGDKTYFWSTGSPVEYTNWNRDFTGNEGGRCVAIQTNVPIGLWATMGCNSNSRAYICETLRSNYSTVPPPTTPAPPPPCPEDWREEGNVCFKLFTPTDPSERRSWTEARDYCRALNADLASIHNNEENLRIGRFPLPPGYRDSEHWIGLHHPDRDGTFVWSDGSSFDFQGWAFNQPETLNGTFNCAADNLMNDRWSMFYCYLKKNWVCKITRGTQLIPTPTFPPIARSPTCVPETDWLHFNGMCYLLATGPPHPAPTDWFRARDYCRLKGGFLASVHSDEENVALMAMLQMKSQQRKVWFGLNELEERGTYRWSDGTAANMFRWHPGEPNDFHYGQRCCNIYPNNGLWNDDFCGTELGFICMKPNATYSSQAPITSTPTPGFCPKGYFGVGNKCFGVFGMVDGETKLNWTGALFDCRGRPGYRPDIASVMSARENAAILAQLTRRDAKAWLGFHANVENEWLWQDESPTIYTNWNLGEPGDTWSSKCAEIVTTEGSAGKWNNAMCNTLNAYVCQVYKDPGSPVRTPATLPPNGQNCAPGFTPYLSGCYKLSDEFDKKSWTDARTACGRTPRGFLVTINSAVENAAMYYLSSMATNEPTWLGLNDRGKTGVYKWDDSWPVGYTNWGANQPNDNLGDDAKCVMMDRDGKWNNTRCGNAYRYLCKTTTEPVPTAPPTDQPGLCPSTEWIPHGLYCYLFKIDDFSSSSSSWTDAEFKCVQEGAHLVSIQDENENKWVREQVEALQGSIKRNIWLGILRIGSTNGWRWADSSPSGYTNWAPGEPNNGGSAGYKENVGSMYITHFISSQIGQWNDVPRNMNDKDFVCKVRKNIITTKPPFIPPTETTTPGVTTSPVPPAGSSKSPTIPRRSTTLTVLQSTNQGEVPQKSAGLSTGGKVGVAFAVLTLALVLVVVLLLFMRRNLLLPFYRPQGSVSNPSYDGRGDKVCLGENESSSYS